jgi:RNA polymerase sigma-70 factor (ECF subfamily)
LEQAAAMADVTWSSLRQLLVDRYEVLRSRLARRLGSDDLACETLSETYLRFERDDTPGVVLNPGAYLYQTALNVGLDRLRDDTRRAHRNDVQSMLDLPDEAPSQDRCLEARLEVERLQAVLEIMPWRQRAILLAVRLGGATHQSLAERFGISKRMVQFELRAALDLCEDHRVS